MDMGDFILAATTNDLTREVEARESADFVEFQMANADEPLRQLEGYNGSLPIIVTNRAVWDTSQGNDEDRLERLLEAAKFDKVEMVDIELSVVKDQKNDIGDLNQYGVDTIISYYDFEKTPEKEDLEGIIEECAEYGDIAKVAVFAKDPSDSLALLEAVDTTTEEGMEVAGVSMGEVGQHTRVIAPLYGSRIAYAPIDLEKSGYAPGQIVLQEFSSLVSMIEKGGKEVELIDSLKGNFPPESRK